ncbi:hypothetical protein HPB51_003811 [Rhipicephalus microplus]|uniref:Uncharacterized protein n=1 Tax=Rhipicephalus microplus TaxID=6941 RepID=A0A9J6EKV5_RHIMP|nr:hypothetical protein HPB51_003811 [Rhipicephalus microplus]
MGLYCDFNLTTCTKCDESVAHKDMPSHFWTCDGAPGVFLPVAEVHSLLDEVDNARKELDNAAVGSASERTLENAVVAVTQVFERLNSHLGTETQESPGTLAGGRFSPITWTYLMPTAGCSSCYDSQHAGDAVPSRETPDVATGRRQHYRYRVAGSGCHTQYQIVEFLDDLQATRFCNWCGLVCHQMCLLSCLHVICPACQDRAFGNSASGFATCLIDKRMLSITMTAVVTNNVRFRRVRCPSWGCGYAGYLKDLNDHLDRHCAFHLTTCAKCEAVVAHKDVWGHFMTCEGAPGVFMQVAEVQSIWENLYNACKDLYGVGECSASVTAPGNAINAVSKLFDRHKRAAVLG